MNPRPAGFVSLIKGSVRVQELTGHIFTPVV
jgi:hypothetical protein